MIRQTIKALVLAVLVSASLTGGIHAAQEAGMYGIVFFKTQKLGELRDFYTQQIGCELWMEQADCLIFRSGNMLFGFCQREKADMDGLITFFYDRKERVDRAYEQFRTSAQAPPRMNEKYRIYHFFARDPEGRMIEFQYFADEIDWAFKPKG